MMAAVADRRYSVCPQTHVDGIPQWREDAAMSGSAIQTWLSMKQKKALLIARIYFVTTLTGGTLALLPNLGIGYLLAKIALLLVFPTTRHVDVWAWLLTGPLVILLFADCIRAERDDMVIIPLWLAREYFHMGPRIILDGREAMIRARQFARVDNELCAELLAYLLPKATPTSRQELSGIFPQLGWMEIVQQLSAIDGVLLFRNVQSVSLLAPLRRELRQWIAQSSIREIPSQEPEAVPINEPRQLSPREILGVPAGASAAEIKTAYRNRVKECHPDRFPNIDEQSRGLAEEWTKAINAAYAELLTQQR
ncbi:MAG TPA: J domain-containing protein [Candidatus Polarisedimenticolia bacterium]|nr:J domain-containing protein [Candidatus Polarisedimenticolia bacterium]